MNTFEATRAARLFLESLSAIVRCQAQVAGMTAENQQRAAVGSSMAYTDDGFTRSIDEMMAEVDRVNRALVDLGG